MCTTWCYVMPLWCSLFKPKINFLVLEIFILFYLFIKWCSSLETILMNKMSKYHKLGFVIEIIFAVIQKSKSHMRSWYVEGPLKKSSWRHQKWIWAEGLLGLLLQSNQLDLNTAYFSKKVQASPPSHCKYLFSKTKSIPASCCHAWYYLHIKTSYASSIGR